MLSYQELEVQKDSAYKERNQCVLMMCKLARNLGMKACRWKHEGIDCDNDWRNIIVIYFPTGQATWHIHDTEMADFEWLPLEANAWDGHTTSEKYDRMRHYMSRIARVD